MSWDSRETFLYRLYSKEGRLIYIGISNAWHHRMQEHRRSQPWWDEVEHVFTISFPDRRSALVAEEAAIKSERPAYNIVHTSSSEWWSAPNWTCDACACPAHLMGKNWFADTDFDQVLLRIGGRADA